MQKDLNQKDKAKETIKALIFASGTGLVVDKIYIELSEFFGKEIIESAIAELENDFSKDNGILLIRYGNKVQFQSNPQYGEIVSKVLVETKEREISKVLLQVLAIIAYKQPITRAEIEDLRGINPEYAISMLLRLNLIYAAGRKDTIGRPILYATTEEFLKKFGLKCLEDMPKYDYIMNEIKTKYEMLYGDSRLFKQKNIPNDNGEDENNSSDVVEVPDFLEGEDFLEIE
ncbi:MAG: SMC-Scp complex subunit ScpB [Christensenellales bacterium]|jgi:segregation and condensation protein B|nr:SMC-Scp complex subunit ScpB [Clostridiales bacterium]